MTNPLARKLAGFVSLSNEDRRVLDELIRPAKLHSAGGHLTRQGERVDSVCVLLVGWACRYRLLGKGERQITALVMPGDFADSHALLWDESRHDIQWITNGLCAAIPRQRMSAIADQSPQLAKAFWWSTLADEAILREWLINMGRKEAYERLAHLICELLLRAFRIGIVKDNTFDFPMTQKQLGDTLGLTAVHVNRMLQRLRAEGHILFNNRRMKVCDMAALQHVAEFESCYLHHNALAAPIAS